MIIYGYYPPPPTPPFGWDASQNYLQVYILPVFINVTEGVSGVNLLSKEATQQGQLFRPCDLASDQGFPSLSF